VIGVETDPRSFEAPMLMDDLRDALQSRHYSRRTEQAYCLWARRYIRFHGMRHPGHKSVNTTMIYTHVINRGGRGVRSPIDVRRAYTDCIRIRHGVGEAAQ
jgi:hypothetical protein